MGENSKIQWTHHTFNPWWGCVKVSPGCQHCYAEAFSKRTGHNIWGVDAERRFFGDKHWREPLKWNREAEAAGERRRVFCASMSDVFELYGTATAAGDRMDEERYKLFDLIEKTPMLDWLLLTKRPQNIMNMIPAEWREQLPVNVWIGTTVEDQRRANERIPELLKVPATVRFLSCEPLLGSVDLYLNFGVNGRYTYPMRSELINWVIVGGESGAGSRLMEPIWAKRLIDDCKLHGVPVFMKQTGSVLARQWELKDSHKGGDIDELPEWMQVREFPQVVKAQVH